MSRLKSNRFCLTTRQSQDCSSCGVYTVMNTTAKQTVFFNSEISENRVDVVTSQVNSGKKF